MPWVRDFTTYLAPIDELQALGSYHGLMVCQTLIIISFDHWSKTMRYTISIMENVKSITAEK